MICVGALLTVLFLAGSAMADTGPIGQVKSVSGEGTIIRGGERIAATVGDAILEGDAIETGPDGGIGITFRDSTVFSAGPNTRASFDQFSFDDTTMEGSFLTALAAGTMTMATGDLADHNPDSVHVKTPTTVIGVRGTTFAVRVGED
jgi:hypothetical protein